jgi:hypothetical protein
MCSRSNTGIPLPVARPAVLARIARNAQEMTSEAARLRRASLIWQCETDQASVDGPPPRHRESRFLWCQIKYSRARSSKYQLRQGGLSLLRSVPVPSGRFTAHFTINLTNHGLSSRLSGCLLYRELRDDCRSDRFPERVIFWPSRRHRAMLPRFGAKLDSCAD